MDDKNIKLIIDKLNELILNDIKRDIENGNKLLSNCNKYLNKCPIKKDANDYMDIMEKKYGLFNALYNFVNGYNGNNNNTAISKCANLEKQIWIIEKVKQVKELSDDVDKYSKLIELLKEELNNE